MFELNKTILALGAESAGNFCYLSKGKVEYCNDFGDLLDEENYQKYLLKLNSILKEKKINPNIILTDLHPLFKTTKLGESLAKKNNAKLIKVQHHMAHASAAAFEYDKSVEEFVAITSDGTGYLDDRTLWGGEVLVFQNKKFTKIGGLEEMKLLGGEKAINEPARMLLSILLQTQDLITTKEYIKKYFSDQEFEVLVKQFKQSFNCLTTTGTARVLDAVSVLLGFSKNEKEYKHQPVDLLEKNSTKSFELEPKIDNNTLSIKSLFEFLIKNLDKDKKRLAATAQLYLAQGFYRIAISQKINHILFSGGMADNKIMSDYMKSQKVFINKKFPSGDKGISLGQLNYYLLTNSGD